MGVRAAIILLKIWTVVYRIGMMERIGLTPNISRRRALRVEEG